MSGGETNRARAVAALAGANPEEGKRGGRSSLDAFLISTDETNFRIARATTRLGGNRQGSCDDKDANQNRRCRWSSGTRASQGTEYALGNRLGVTFQQMQKYEKGTNRIGAGRLHAIAEALGVSVNYFFPDSNSLANSDETLDLLSMPGAIDLLRHFGGIKDKAVRKSLGNLTKTLAAIGFNAAVNPTQRKGSRGSALDVPVRH